MRLEPVADTGADLADAAVLVRYTQADALAQISERLCSRLVDKGQIFLPRCLAVLQRERPDLERDRTCHTIINIVQRIEINVRFPLPVGVAP